MACSIVQGLYYFLIFLFVAFILSALIPEEFLDSYLPETDWDNKTQSVMFLSMFVVVAWLFKKIGRKSGKLKRWATDTFFGVTTAVVTFIFLLMLSVTLFMLIPLHGFILLLLSIVVSIFAAVIFFNMIDE